MPNPIFFNVPTIDTAANQANLGTEFSNGVRMGSVRSPTYGNGAPGVLTSPIVVYDAQPLASVANALAPAGVVAAAGALIRASTNPGSNVTQVQLSNNTPALKLDVPRSIQVGQTAGGSGAATTVVIYGLDGWGLPMVEQVVTVGAAGGNVQTKKAFYYVQGFHVIAGSGTSLNYTTGNKFGLPYYCADAGYIHATWGGVTVSNGGGTSTAIDFPGDNKTALLPYAILPGSTATPTATSNDVRGTIFIDSTAGGSPIDGTSRLVMWQYVPGATNTDTANPRPNTYVPGLYGLPQFTQPVPIFP